MLINVMFINLIYFSDKSLLITGKGEDKLSEKTVRIVAEKKKASRYERKGRKAHSSCSNAKSHPW